jgi:hypothetical protein
VCRLEDALAEISKAEEASDGLKDENKTLSAIVDEVRNKVSPSAFRAPVPTWLPFASVTVTSCLSTLRGL